jgi:hypothetical protein
MARLQQCWCGSGLWPDANHDARGIFLCYSCDKCHTEKMSHYRPEVLTDSNYDAVEEIDGDGGHPDQSEGDLDFERVA